MSSKLPKIVAPLAVVAVGASAAVLLASAREAPPREERRSLAPLVSFTAAELAELPQTVEAQGTVRPRQRVQLVPQVAGRVVEVHSSLVEGGLVDRGDVLVTIEAVDYELRVRRAEADVARAEVRLQTERAEAELARQEWERLRPGEDAPGPLVVREPQVRQAEAELAATRAALDEARLALERTRLRAPFDAKVESENVAPGQFLVAGQPIGTLRGLRTLEIPVPLEDRDLAWFEAPGATARVTVPFAGRTWTWTGDVVRLAGVDPRTRMVTVIVEVVDEPSGERPGLEPGLFADVEIEGRSVRAIPVPRTALHDGDVWIVDADETLRIRKVEVARTMREVALVTAGIEDGDRIVTTTLEAVTDGMPVRVAQEGDSSSTEPEGARS